MATDLQTQDPVRGTTAPDRCWTFTNVAEASPLVLTALEWSIWGQAVELGARGAWCDFGFLPRQAVRRSPVQDELVTGCFFGRQALNVDLTREIMGMIPGSSADDFERDMLGSVRPDAKPVPNSVRRLPVIAVKAPSVLRRQSREVAARHAEQVRWWQSVVLSGQDQAPLVLLEDAVRRFTETMRVHVRSRTLLQGLQAQVTDLCAGAGCAELVPALLSGYGQVTETGVADDLWQVAAGTLSRTDFLARHGFHGPNEGNPRSRSWREQPALVDAMAAAAGERSATQRPRDRELAAVRRREAAETDLLARLSGPKRRVASVLLRAAGTQVRNLELGKAAYVAAIDGCRRAARDLGAQLASSGVLAEPEDVFHLTRDELARLPGDPRALVATRRAAHEAYEAMELPVTFTGMPTPLRAPQGEQEQAIRGATGAPGRVEGLARVVLDPDDGDVLEEGEVLVCRFTDPGWAPLFSLAEGLVIDVGGPSSHGAIVARELGIPCVIGTGDGTRRLRTGDRVVVDGDAGLVTVLERA